MTVIKVGTKAEFDEKLKNAGDKAVIVDFTATWCGPCKMIGPKFEAMSAEYTNIVFLKVDVDENSETAESCGVSAMPTFKVYKDSKKVDEMVGANEAKLKDLCEKFNN